VIPYSRQSVDKKDIASVVKILKSNFLTQGPKVEEFEKNISNLCRSKYVVASNSATSSLHIACLALNLKSKDIVWTVPNTFVASANCAINCGAEVDFVDIDAKTFNICISSLEKKLIDAKKKGKLPKILIPVHFAGQPTNQKKIWQLSKKYKFKIIEDASHSIGASFEDEPVGSCKWSDITVFSFHPVKIITTGEGGAGLTNNKLIYEKMKSLRTNGIVKDLKYLKFKKNLPWYYEHHSSGFNYRMNDISASLGISQLQKIKKFIKKRNQIAKLYKSYLQGLPLQFQKIDSKINSSYHLFVIQFDLKKTKYNYLKIFKKLREKKYFVNLHYMPLHLSPFFKKKGFKVNQYPVAEKYAKTAISLPIYYDLKLKDVKKICILIKSFFKK
jgi:UDP-4-amino-4,6-dideoxy-N-acetyl-beta-L-altrosamine transaminase